MESWKRHFRRGKENLAKHHPRSALKELQLAIEECPTKEQSSLAKIMFYMGITLKKLGVPNGAVRSWVVAQKLNKTGYSSKMIKRFVNDYGMTKQKTVYEDDWKAFHAIQLSKYIEIKNGPGGFDGPAERDLVTDIIWERWNELHGENVLHNVSTEEKIKYFQDVDIFHGNESGKRCIQVDFTSKQRISYSDRCFCGSGLAFGKCCGRTQGEDELCDGYY